MKRIELNLAGIDGVKHYMAVAFIDSYGDVLVKELDTVDEIVDPTDVFVLCGRCAKPVLDSSIVPESGGLCNRCITTLKSGIEAWLEQNFKHIYRTLQQVNLDCAQSGESVVAFTDTDYYTTQLEDFLDLSSSDAHIVAGWLRKFVMFQCSATAVDNLKNYVTACNDDLEPEPGMVYCDSLGISVADDGWYLQIGNCQYQSDKLEDLELELFLYAMSEGYCDSM